MLCCGRSWANCLAGVIATATVGPLNAAPYMPAHAVESTDAGPKPLIVPAPHRGQDRNFGGYGKGSSAEPPAEYRQAPLGGLASDPLEQGPPSTRGQTEAVNAVGWTQPPTEQPRQFPPSSLGHCLAVVGAVSKPGCHELPTRSVSVAELMDRCGGLTSTATGTLAVIRDGRALGLAYNPQDRLLSGDVIVVAEKPSAISQVAPTGLKDAPGSERAVTGVQLGLVNVLDRPVPVLIPTSHATVAGVLAIANQTHLRPDQIKVIMGGTEEMFGDQATELTPGTVLIFPPGSVRRETLGEVKTRFYPVVTQGITSEPAPMNVEPALQSLGAPSMMNASIVEVPEGAPLQMPPSDLASPAAAADLTTLPRVEMLDAPADDALSFPRTADASGSVPIGSPEAGSHIVPFPSDAIDAGVTPPAVASASPPAVTLSEEAESTEGTRGLPTFFEFAPTLLIGTILGAATFFVLRQWRKRTLSDSSLISRLSALPQSFRQSKTLRAAEPRAFSPDEMLSALIANRLALREETVLLAPALQLYGRSPAMTHRRVDPPNAEIAQPHIPLTVTSRGEISEGLATVAGQASEARRGTARVRFDKAEEPTASKTPATAGTPFERALAAMRSGHK